MRKTASFLIMTLLFVSLFHTGVFANNETSIILNGQKIELVTPHTFKAGRTMITIDSGFFEKLGAEVRHEESEGKIRIEGKYSSVELTLNESVAYIHRKYDFTGIPQTVEMDVEPFADDGKIYVPLRFAAEGLDALVDWDGVNRLVLVKTATDHDIIPVEAPLEYKEMSLHDISGELAEWYEANRKTQGIWFRIADNKTYILICAGEKPTGGYSVQLDSVTMVSPGSVYVAARINSPDPDMFVTQVLTYPCMLIVIEDAEIQQVDGIMYSGVRDLPLKSS